MLLLWLLYFLFFNKFLRTVFILETVSLESGLFVILIHPYKAESNKVNIEKIVKLFQNLNDQIDYHQPIEGYNSC